MRTNVFKGTCFVCGHKQGYKGKENPGLSNCLKCKSYLSVDYMHKMFDKSIMTK